METEISLTDVTLDVRGSYDVNFILAVTVQALGHLGRAAQSVDLREAAHSRRPIAINSIVEPGLRILVICREMVLLLLARLPKRLAEGQMALLAQYVGGAIKLESFAQLVAQEVADCSARLHFGNKAAPGKDIINQDIARGAIVFR